MQKLILFRRLWLISVIFITHTVLAQNVGREKDLIKDYLSHEDFIGFHYSENIDSLNYRNVGITYKKLHDKEIPIVLFQADLKPANLNITVLMVGFPRNLFGFTKENQQHLIYGLMENSPVDIQFYNNIEYDSRVYVTAYFQDKIELIDQTRFDQVLNRLLSFVEQQTSNLDRITMGFISQFIKSDQSEEVKNTSVHDSIYFKNFLETSDDFGVVIPKFETKFYVRN